MHAAPIDMQLPSFSLPTFKGDRKQWASFKDIFTSSVDMKNLTNALKLQFLMSHLEEEAKSLVSSYAITDVNYKQVWDTLVEHYDKPKFAVSALVHEFCDQPVIKAMNLTNLRKLVSTSDEVIRQLKAMGNAYKTRDPWLIHLVLKNLDDNLHSQWATHIVDIDNPTFDELLKFLKRKCDAFETCAAFGGKHLDHVKKEIYKEEKKPIKKEINSFYVVEQHSCPMCSGDHGIYKCSTIKEASVKARREFVQQARLCFNCLHSNHCAKSCPSNNQFHKVRAMIDSGSQASLITEHCITILGLDRKNAKVVISGIVNSASETTRGVVDLEISSRFDYKPVIQTKAYVLSKLSTNIPSQKIDASRLKCLDLVPLADPDFDKPNKVDLILGVDVFLSIVEDGKIRMIWEPQ
ncbi:uncharacterized protein LOC135702229 [Ochlerotatus camptorhynchus]|uniref:uncharacterized protein LOC135702229 n=1 Tax=Ochlerotatus camptorhynchus TaxID=644619 RepID=UPI0031E3006E